MRRAYGKRKNSKLEKAHEFSMNNQSALQKSKLCGCFYCLKIYDPHEIKAWIVDQEDTAVCPYCGIDSVLPESTEYQITEEFLEKMREYWFW